MPQLTFSTIRIRDGAFTANDPQVRAYALQKTMRAMDIGAELGAKIFVLWAAAKAQRLTLAAVRMKQSSVYARR